ncbi:MAG: 1,4-alpha-glucan branching protein GlgB [Candidatus Delongbacteria bacterium]|nr:1,4-alpha-glucan branching protein GlgB [Candidatus Delongbacteria bacterium]
MVSKETETQELKKISSVSHHDPFIILGQHHLDPIKRHGIIIRTYQPYAEAVHLVETTTGKIYPMNPTDIQGFFKAEFPRRRNFFAYTYQIDYPGGYRDMIEDPYRFLPVISEYDLYLFNEGNHHYAYNFLGSHSMTVDGIGGVLFAVWAPSARSISVVGDFNRWDGRLHPMRIRGSSGIWELFIPNLGEGCLYKYEIHPQQGDPFLKSDPYGYYQEMRPKTASIVYEHRYHWQDADYIAHRDQSKSLNQPVTIYEVHPGSWRRVPDENNRPLSYRELADQIIPYMQDMGYTHLELMPILEHPLDDSWGYQVTGYYAATSRFGPPDDLKYLIDQCHQHQIGVILDWVPGHFPRDAMGLARFDGTHLYEHQDPREGEHPDWGTLIFNYGRNEVRSFLLSNAVFWMKEFHFDGLRMDAVASMLYRDYGKKAGEWIPNQFGGKENLEAISLIRKINEVIYSYFPNAMMIAEESTAFSGVSRPVYLGGLGFGYKWNMGWMHDTLLYFSKDPIHRQYHHNHITFSLLYAFSENYILVLSHDEVVHGKKSLLDKMPGDMWQKFANLRLYLSFMMTHPGKKLLFMGGELGQWKEWDFKTSLDWHLLEFTPHRKFKKFVQDLNHLYLQSPALWEDDNQPESFEWIDFRDTRNSVLSYIRRGKEPGTIMITVLNMTPVPREDYRIGVPVYAYYQECLNSDSGIYWGSNLGNNGGIQADGIAWQGQPFSLLLTLPPLSALILKPI